MAVGVGSTCGKQGATGKIQVKIKYNIIKGETCR